MAAIRTARMVERYMILLPRAMWKWVVLPKANGHTVCMHSKWRAFSLPMKKRLPGAKDLLASTSGQTVGKRGGDYIWADLNGDNVIDSKDMVFMGYRAPDKIGGMQNTF